MLSCWARSLVILREDFMSLRLATVHENAPGGLRMTGLWISEEGARATRNGYDFLRVK